jgi:hypothetical protein
MQVKALRLSLDQGLKVILRNTLAEYTNPNLRVFFYFETSGIFKALAPNGSEGSLIVKNEIKRKVVTGKFC